MDLGTSGLFYLMLGVSVAFAVGLRSKRGGVGWWLFQVATAVLFWPLFVPWLLEPPATRDGSEDHPVSPRDEKDAPQDNIAQAIVQVEQELETALASLDGWAESALDGADKRLAELRLAWHHQAERIRELDRLLEQAELRSERPEEEWGEESNLPGEVEDRIVQRRRSRSANLRRLQAVRRQCYRDLMGTLSWVRELVTMIHLAKYSGASASRARELVSQIAASVEGLSDVSTWSRREIDAGRRMGRNDESVPYRKTVGE